jgi:hypothetical protein
VPEAALSASLGGGFAGLAVEGREGAVLQHTSFGFHPVLQGQSFLLSTLIVEMLRVQADLSFEQLGHECSLFLSTGLAVQNYSLTLIGALVCPMFLLSAVSMIKEKY